MGYVLKVALTGCPGGLDMGCRWVERRDWGIKLSNPSSSGFVLEEFNGRMRFYQFPVQGSKTVGPTGKTA